MTTPFLTIARATVWQGSTAALRELDLTLSLGESVAILGPNGAGKSTLLKLLAGQLRPAYHPETRCELFGKRLWDLDTLRERIGLVMPEEVNRFHPAEEAFDVVLSSLQGAYGITRQMRFSDADRRATREVIERVGVGPLAGKPFGQLSSGEQRRFLIARALVHQPEVIVLDEPSTALDFAAAVTLGQTLRQLLREGQTLVWVTHHPSEIPPEVQRVILLQAGRVFADGTPREELTSARLSELYGLPLSVDWHRGWCEVRPEE
ncbi:ABC transporter ATP-binding protein [Roseibacillus ishigakijimensis]|uniref:Metal ABC transporter ATP-binding protein n=1 Tax=Roseibacillus ishigakijimensis TaxID=454146 RepID=A0A934RRS2_9BACT|nr:metal ABC transporter ATP-binding protein [Roseibacillus ishigakijimensis]MBK1833055.1 metal ABC transporter ATP-binding protein [Roseibacillus ishigakijimensis]